ncbi:BON domain-containing protein [Luteimonas sp. BDR2-5]|uniref:BON domain-containing protein n=1 Tax=Proluteimonas luteida TaxID=2878685 RepID=UPI001E64141A|nr:BON domain-containing protein [Luteimonas sp. BDR2-5]MCD9028620.1 BON domain-containing protein [Luteimonas sp. BDR2-5]
MTPQSPAPDDLLGDNVVTALARDPGIEAGEVLVEVADGVVTLTGDVPERPMIEAALKLVSSLDGVREVRNLLHFDDGSRSAGRPGEAVAGAETQGGPGSTAELDLEEDG